MHEYKQWSSDSHREADRLSESVKVTQREKISSPTVFVREWKNKETQTSQSFSLASKGAADDDTLVTH